MRRLRNIFEDFENTGLRKFKNKGLRKFIFKDTEKNMELVLPITPQSFEVSNGINIETINIHTLGDIGLAGYETLPTFRIDCMFPAKKYPFNQPNTDLNPYNYIKKFENWCNKHTILRFVVSKAKINIPVIITDITYGEKDGTGDVYASITIRKYRKLAQVQKNNTGNSMRLAEKSTANPNTYIIKKGDTLGAICRKFYGNSSLSSKFAKYNGIKNQNLIYAGKTLKIPDKSLL